MRAKSPANKLLVIILLAIFCSKSKQISLNVAEPSNYCHRSVASDDCKSDIILYAKPLSTEESIVSYAYDYFDFCNNAETNLTKDKYELFGDYLDTLIFGDRIRAAPLKIEFLKNVDCEAVCKLNYTIHDVESERKLLSLRKAIRLNYQNSWIVDGLPVTWCYHLENNKSYCMNRFPLGCLVEHDNYGCPIDISHQMRDAYYVYNHVDLIIKYHSGKNEAWGAQFQSKGGRLLSIEVVPSSINHKDINNLDCSVKEPLQLKNSISQAQEIIYTYSVKFLIDDSANWISRWDYLLESMPQTHINWSSILASVVCVMFLAILALIVLCSVRKSIAQRKNLKSEEASTGSDHGWQLLHGDIFRAPRRGMLMSALLGTGVQVTFATTITLCLAFLNFFKPISSAALIFSFIVSYAISGPPAGFVSARIYKSFSGTKWLSNLMLTSMLCPGLVYFLICVINIVLMSANSAGALSIRTLLVFLAIWLGISVPLTFLGAYIDYCIQPLVYPVQTNQTPCEIPAQPIYTRFMPNIILGGLLPFVCIFMPLFYILNSIWYHQVYYNYGLQFIAFLSLIITCAGTTISLCYFHLRAGNYHWWRRAFLSPAFSAFYMLIYCVYYFFTKLDINDGISIFLYFAYTAIMVIMFFLFTGTIGFFACFGFMRKIYGLIENDSN